MNIVKNYKGITIISLVITIIVLLILAGVSLTIANGLILDKAVAATSKTTESLLQEKIEIAWDECEISYYSDNPNQDINEYFNENFENILKKNVDDLEDLNIEGSRKDGFYSNFKYKGKQYSYEISSVGIAKFGYLLKGNVKVGDYIEYPVEYNDVYTGEHYTARAGWRVLDDGVMEGTTGNVRIVSTYIPAKWYYNLEEYPNNQTAVNKLLDNFEDLELVDDEIANSIRGSYFKVQSISEKVTILTLSDLNYAYNELYETNREAMDISNLSKNDGLFYIRDPGSYYWLATNNSDNDTDIYYMSNEGINSSLDLRLGIKPVIILKKNLTGVLNNNVWEIND